MSHFYDDSGIIVSYFGLLHNKEILRSFPPGRSHVSVYVSPKQRLFRSSRISLNDAGRCHGQHGMTCLDEESNY